MYSELYNTTQLPIVTESFYGDGYGRVNKRNIKALASTHYDHFVTNSYEFIIVNIHSVLAGAKKILENNGFITRFDDTYKTWEANFIAYRNSSLKNTYIYTHDIVMCVMVCEANTYDEINCFIKYYLLQGVEKIFIYYIGVLTDQVKVLLPQYKQVEYNEWNFTPFMLNTPNGRIHYTQVPLYDMFLKKYSLNCNWSIFCDIDEFLFCRNSETLGVFLQNKNTNLFASNVYAKINFDTNIVEHEDIDMLKSNRRGKSIIKGGLIGISDCAHVHEVLRAKEDKTQLISLHNRNPLSTEVVLSEKHQYPISRII